MAQMGFLPRKILDIFGSFGEMLHDSMVYICYLSGKDRHFCWKNLHGNEGLGVAVPMMRPRMRQLMIVYLDTNPNRKES